MAPASSTKGRTTKVPPAPGVVDAAAELLHSAGGKSGQLKAKSEHGSLLLKTFVLAAGRKTYALRTAHPSRTAWLQREAWVLRHLEGAPMIPQLIATSDGTSALPQPHHLV